MNYTMNPSKIAILPDGEVVLGDSGRGRRETAFVVRAPANPDQCLVRVNTEGCYTRNSDGAAEILRGGRELARGNRAAGDAGGLGHYPDVMLLLDANALVRVVFSGGRGKGYGARYLVRIGGGEPRLVDVLGGTTTSEELRDIISMIPPGHTRLAEIELAAAKVAEKDNY